MSRNETTYLWDSIFPTCPDSVDPMTDADLLGLIPTRREYWCDDRKKMVVEHYTDRLPNSNLYRQLRREHQENTQAAQLKYDRRQITKRITNGNLDGADLLASDRFIKLMHGPAIVDLTRDKDIPLAERQAAAQAELDSIGA